MPARGVEATSAAVWLCAVIGFAVVGLGALAAYAPTLGQGGRGTWGTSDRFLNIMTGTEIESETLAASLSQLPPTQPVVVVGPVTEVEHWYGVWYLVGYLGWPHPVSSLLCRQPGQMNDYPPLPATDAPAGTAVVLLGQHPDGLQAGGGPGPTVFSPNLSMVSLVEPRPWNSFCQ